MNKDKKSVTEGFEECATLQTPDPGIGQILAERSSSGIHQHACMA
jgi:hypothetical protein